MSDPFNDKSGLWSGLGFAAVIMALCLGVGTCSALSNLGDDRAQPKLNADEAGGEQ